MDSRTHDDHTMTEPAEAPFSLSHLVHTLRAYSSVIILALASAAVIYALVAVTFLLMKPSQAFTSLRFRLSFTGSDRGLYPNGAKFNSSSIISTPVLLKVYRANDLDRFMKFEEFGRSIIVLESNPALVKLAAEYEARLADPKLSPVERDRVTQEFDAKRSSLDKSDYALTFMRNAGKIPETLAKKVLSDILVTWSNDAENEQQLMDFPIDVAAPEILAAGKNDSTSPLVQLLILRSRIKQVLSNITELERVPGATIIRASGERLSLIEISTRLEDILRFRVDPLIAAVRAGGLVQGSVSATDFVERQLAYDSLHLESLRAESEAIRNSLVIYSTNSGGVNPDTTAIASQLTGKEKGGEGVTPMLSESFLDRLVSLSSKSQDVEFRQTAAKRYRDSMLAMIPAQEAVTFDRNILEMIKRGPAGGAAMSDQQAAAEIEAIRAESKGLVLQMNGIYQILSRTINPASQIYSITDAPTSRIERSGDLHRTFLGLFLVLLMTLPVAVVACLLHNRVREEEAIEGSNAEHASPQSA